ncbi:MAG TPA: agmatine deiminase family protein [Baekduia sp.]|uniref:agmatine deiminase family protein n=1 Tax=Baekduia sp. TaxID=2600305 RepID=UPI002D79480A|nr:agmatine deiminase family protein [Baekduia sp.]HET6505753.1 agmatine deiminase family protein [Baekduia sp.]
MTETPTPAAEGLSMPPEWTAHERTLMAWPCRRELWGGQLGAAKAESAGVANAIAAFEPVTMVARDAADAQEARAALDADVEILTAPVDDSWLRDSGPIFVVDHHDEPSRRVGVHFGFNSWGDKFEGYENDAAIGRRLTEHVGSEVVRAPLILEGGSIGVDGTGTLVTTEQCLLHPNRNPDLSKDEIERHLKDYLGVTRVVWLEQGLVEDRDTDGHVDLIAAFLGPDRMLLQRCAPDNPNHDNMARNREIAVAAGIEVVDFDPLAYTSVDGEEIVASYMNFYVGSRFVIVPTAGQPDLDAEALAAIDAAFGGTKEIVGVPGVVHAFGGGGPHCITQQVPALG